LDKRDSPNIPFIFPDKYETELNGLAEIRKKIFSNWENLKYQDHWIHGYFNPNFSFDSFCDEVMNRPSTNNYMLLLNANNECASYFDQIGSNKWKIFTDRIIELLKKNDTELIYPEEYGTIVSVMYYSDINNILDYYEAFMDIFISVRCKSCNDAEELFDFMEAYEDLGEVSYGQADAMRYIRMNHVEYLSEKYFWDSKEITLWGDDLIELIEQDIAYIKNKMLNKEEDSSRYLSEFQLTYLDANNNIFNQLVNNNSCNQAMKFYNQFKMLDRKVISDLIYTELNESTAR
ncbi:MAG: hypothetical protein EBT51_11015, partial [Flavobacteriaceae bacterium]|nr:hypothetical protein [Flavobacteriaceae bacterium]